MAALLTALLFAIPLIASSPDGTTEPASVKERDEPRDVRPSTGGRARKSAEADDPDLPVPNGVTDKGEYLRKREAYIMLRRGLPYPAGQPNPRSLAIRQMEAQEARIYGRRAQSQFFPAQRQPLLNSTSWTSIGPEPIPNGQTVDVSVPVSGRVTAIAIHPSNPNIVYVGTASGGVYRTLDGGGSWTALMDGALSLAIGSITIDPGNPSTVVVGTGEGNDAFFGVGLYRITNADGVSFGLEGPFNLDTNGIDVFSGISITRVLISPTDHNIVFVSTVSGSGGRDNSFPVSPPARGIFRPTNFMTAAPRFTKLTVTNANNGDRRVTDMVFEPGNPNHLIAHVGGFAAANSVPDGGIYMSINALDASPTFTQTLARESMQPPPATYNSILNVKFAINKVGTTVTVLAATEESLCSGVDGALRRSTDGGQTWSAPLPSASGFCGSQCFFDIGIAIHPTDGNQILLGGSGSYDPFASCVSSAQLRSIDGAQTFVRADTKLHADTHAIEFAPSNPMIVYAGNDGGIFKSTDSGATWTSLNTTGFNATQFYSLSSHPLDRFFTLGGTQDNGTEMSNLDGSWVRADFGDGGFALIDRNVSERNPFLMYHTYYNLTNDIIGFARIDRPEEAHDDGWATLGSGFVNNGIGNDPSVLFFAPMALGPGKPSTLYFGTDRLYRSANSGLNMAVVSQAPLVTQRPVTSIAVSPQDDNVRMVGLSDGSIFLTTSGSAQMTDLSSPLPLKFAGSVAIDPHDKNIGYVTYCGYGLAAGAHVWKNANLSGGATNWLVSGSGIPDVPVNALVIDPRNSSTLFAGTDIGVYASTDAGNTWNPFGTGMPRVPVFALDIQDQSRVLRAATHGRGVWEIAIAGTQVAALSIAGVTAAPTTGNGNAFIEPGENGSLTIQVNNHGVVSATGVSATISTTSNGVSILNPTSALANIPAGGSASNSTPLTFGIASSVACGTAINFTITITFSGAPSPIVDVFRIVLGGPSSSPATFSYGGSAVTIPGGNLNGALAPITVNGVNGPIAKVMLTIGGSQCIASYGSTTVGIDTNWVGDFQLYLISPSGTTVPLSINSGTGANLCNTVFDDSATTPFALAQAPNPYSGTFSPAAPLSTLAGENANGTWQLKVVSGYSVSTGHVRAFSITITPAACALVLTPPLNFAATETSTSTAAVSWAPVTGADHYDVYRSLNNVAYTVAGSPTGTSLNDTGLSAGTTYFYKVKAVAPLTSSDFSVIDLATTIAFTDDPLVPGATTIKSAHLVELRNAVNAIRVTLGLSAISFVNSLAPGTPVRATDIVEIRTALAGVLSALGLPATFTDDPLVIGSTPIRAVHVQELRQKIK